MDDHPIRERDESGGGPTPAPEESWLRTATGAWPAWLVGVGTLLLAGYFFFTEGVWPNTAETFYALIFGVVAAIALGYGGYRVRSRRSRL
ncbi:hypothetical protein [Halomarina pelagica]|uniref:hypothetical protein n=1 Tax=Halomarina pelagica TaxID=2961599 RepID=UPI0020C43F1A|nr:hypothetical protein [Halomarina sp. BND7]